MLSQAHFHLLLGFCPSKVGIKTRKHAIFVWFVARQLENDTWTVTSRPHLCFSPINLFAWNSNSVRAKTAAGFVSETN